MKTVATRRMVSWSMTCMACLVGQANAASAPSSAPPTLSKPTNIGLGDPQEQITVWGHRGKFSAAPTPDSRFLEPDAPIGFGPGSRLGSATVEGGPIHGAISDGVSAGVAIPVAGVEGLDFTASLAGTRDGLSPSGTTGAASALAGLRLKF